MIFATQIYIGHSEAKKWKSIEYDEHLEDAVETLKGIYDDHIAACEDKVVWPYHQITDFRIKGLQHEQQFTGE
jgi:hypothetical protein